MSNLHLVNDEIATLTEVKGTINKTETIKPMPHRPTPILSLFSFKQ